MQIGVIGLGTIATALVEGIAGAGHQITVSTRSRKNAQDLAKRFDNVTVAENQQIVDASDIIFVGLIADVAPSILEPLQFREGQWIISLMANQSIAATSTMVAPATMAARMIPFPSIVKGGSQILAYGDCELIHGLFGARNSIFELETEKELGTYLCAQAVLSPAISMVQGAADWITHSGSDRDRAEAFLRELVGSSLLGASCGALLHALNTPGGYNQRLRQHMIGTGLLDNLHDGLDRLLE